MKNLHIIKNLLVFILILSACNPSKKSVQTSAPQQKSHDDKKQISDSEAGKIEHSDKTQTPKAVSPPQSTVPAQPKMNQCQHSLKAIECFRHSYFLSEKFLVCGNYLDFIFIKYPKWNIEISHIKNTCDSLFPLDTASKPSDCLNSDSEECKNTFRIVHQRIQCMKTMANENGDCNMDSAKIDRLLTYEILDYIETQNYNLLDVCKDENSYSDMFPQMEIKNCERHGMRECLQIYGNFLEEFNKHSDCTFLTKWLNQDNKHWLLMKEISAQPEQESADLAESAIKELTEQSTTEEKQDQEQTGESPGLDKTDSVQTESAENSQEQKTDETAQEETETAQNPKEITEEQTAQEETAEESTTQTESDDIQPENTTEQSTE